VAVRECYPELPSTQDRAIELARAGAEEGTVVVARRQSRGRGRGQRSWESPHGGLYLSVVLRPPSVPALLPLAIGAEIADTFSMEYGVRLRVKWPNDLLTVDASGAPRKLAGVLVDVVPAPDGGPAAVVGIGVNVIRPGAELSRDVSARAVALDELTAAPVHLEALERLVADAAVRAGRLLSVAGSAGAVLARVRGLLYGVGEPVTVDGEPVGMLRTVSDSGALEVVGSTGLRTIHAGDVHVGVGQ